MNFFDEVDVDERYLLKKYPKILELLVCDKTTNKNIIWATDSYNDINLFFNDHISSKIIGENNIIVPRSKKEKNEQSKRSKDNAEVFTPSWMCNVQNNLIDEVWFGKRDVFNKEINNNTWKTNHEKIAFQDKEWIDYVRDIRIEITCGEAPYIVSRYDTVTGKKIKLENRIGLLDRKMRIVKENVSNEEEWIKYSLEALKSVYGFEWQGDNLILARENILLSYCDYYYDYFNDYPDEKTLLEVANIIAWNFWQMDGIKCVIPNSCKVEDDVEINLFEEESVVKCECKGCKNNDVFKHNGIYSKIMDWIDNKPIRFVDMIRRK